MRRRIKLVFYAMYTYGTVRYSYIDTQQLFIHL
jgi:hypothetical protein